MNYSIFVTFFETGLAHIADFKGYDHILFIVTLCGIYLLREWRHILVLVTAFTIGHSLTLALATLNLLHISPAWIEFLIPVTIFVTAVENILRRRVEFSMLQHRIKYALALFFGLIHGLGFSNYLRSLLGLHEGLLWPLFSFNVGIEAGQLLIVSAILFLSQLFYKLAKVDHREWNLVISGAGGGIALILIVERFPT